MSSALPLEILPLLPSDLPSASHLYASAFLPGAVGRALYPAADAAELARLLNIRLSKLADKPQQKLIKAVRGGEVVGYAWFGAPEAEAEAGAGEGGAEAGEAEATEFAAGTRVELLKQFVEHLGTHPDHQRTGVAKALAQWGIDRACEDGLDLHLDATVEGIPLYTKLGFIKSAEPIWLRDHSAAFYPMVLRHKPSE